MTVTAAPTFDNVDVVLDDIFSSSHSLQPQLLSPHKYSFKDIPPVPLKTVMQCLHENEVGDARLFSILFADKVVFDHIAHEWYIWQGHYWRQDKVRHVRNLVSGVLASAYIRASAELNLTCKQTRVEGEIDILTPLTEEEEKEQEKEKECKRTVKALQTRSRQLMYLDRIKHVLELAQSLLPVPQGVEWDQNPWVLGVKNGILNLKTGGLEPGNPKDYIRTISPIEWKGLYEPASNFEKFLREIFEMREVGNHQFVKRSEPEIDELVGFMRRALGYGITGLVIENIFLFLYGDEGRNGKNTLLDKITGVMGPLAGKISKDVFLTVGGTRAPGSATPHIMALQGKRIAWAEEPNSGQRFDLAQLKELTGGSEQEGRNNYEKATRTFKPTHLLILLSNPKPHADSKDKAFWARICPVPFNMRFLPAEEMTGKVNERIKDVQMGEKLEAEHSGILAWLVRGCLEWQKTGLSIPREILEERKKYQVEEDTLNIFLAEVCIEGETHKVPCGELYKNYSDWCETNNMKPMTGPAFGKEMVKRYEKSPRTSKGYYYLKIGLQSEYGEPPAELHPDEQRIKDMEDVLDKFIPTNTIVLNSRQYTDAGTVETVPLRAGQAIAYLRSMLLGTDEQAKVYARRTIDDALPIWKTMK